MTTRHHRDLVVIGASAGGVEALRDVAGGLPADLPAAVLAVLHLPSGGTSALAEILDRAGPLPSTTARHGEVLEHGRLYVGPPDHHLLVHDDWLALSRGPTENGHRPAVNALFRSAAVGQGARVIGVVLSGVLDDGAAGLGAIKSRGGLAVVQDPEDAAYRGMPEAALRAVEADQIVPARAIGELLTELVRLELPDGPATEPSRLLHFENAVAQNTVPSEFDLSQLGRFAGLTCPDCHGALVALEPGQDRFRCRVGHAWSADALLATADHRMQNALWMALRTLDEKASLARRMAESARCRGSDHLAVRYDRTAEEAGEAARVLRERLDAAGSRPDDKPDDQPERGAS